MSDVASVYSSNSSVESARARSSPHPMTALRLHDDLPSQPFRRMYEVPLLEMDDSFSTDTCYVIIRPSIPRRYELVDLGSNPRWNTTVLSMCFRPNTMYDWIASGTCAYDEVFTYIDIYLIPELYNPFSPYPSNAMVPLLDNLVAQPARATHVAFSCNMQYLDQPFQVFSSYYNSNRLNCENKAVVSLQKKWPSYGVLVWRDPVIV
ncbi:hypothetical protein L226DRAFT_525832 [Lentinus tigrinus ALCF2SS1-7]|uniref:Uncharacterized protein n=1 Tax=Lentinus tigrinus ALCF2SS1-6 TaxID=1328759 RepID=A0A5C2RTC8_9APHY|nr:hypothetical protein L227DRAFT_567757 [Lentinus tigrinus ALCF2SS1-6]RPD70532.1 hypothetical protein L226DRAFT_525832 [Lentinus tigrinus ALCF2SS1-7]